MPEFTRTYAEKLDELREEIKQVGFDDAAKIREYVNRFASANPDQARERSSSGAEQLTHTIRADLGLSLGSTPGATSVIPEHVADLVAGRAQATDDTSRHAVHHSASQVTMSSGQFVHERTHVYLDGAGMNLAFHCTYKNQGFSNGPLGVNWDHSYNLGLRVLDAGATVTRLTGGFQESTYFRHPAGYWMPPPGEHNVILHRTQAGTFGITASDGGPAWEYAVRESDGTVFFYDPAPGTPGRFQISSIRDHGGNFLRFFYANHANALLPVMERIEINHPARWVEFDHDSTGRIVRIQDHVGREWSYEYDDFGDLIAFTSPGTDRYPDGHTERYAYSSPSTTGALQHNLLQVYDTANRLYIENEYGSSIGALDFNRVKRQMEGHGERILQYETIGLETGPTPGHPNHLGEDIPVHRTVLTRRSGRTVGYIYNHVGNLIAREELDGPSNDRLVASYRYNRDGALVAEVSPEGRVTQYVYGRDLVAAAPAFEGLEEEQLLEQLTWTERLAFGNRISVVRRSRVLQHTLTFPPALPDPQQAIGAEDIVRTFEYDGNQAAPLQQVTAISHPHYPGLETRLHYRPSPEHHLLDRIEYPEAAQPGGAAPIQGIVERFEQHDSRGRLERYVDEVGTAVELSYVEDLPGEPPNPTTGYLKKQIFDADGAKREIDYFVNDVGVVTWLQTPKRHWLKFDIDPLNRITCATRYLEPHENAPGDGPRPTTPPTEAPGIPYRTRYAYCRNMRVEQIDRDVKDDSGQPLAGGVERQFFCYDENDNITEERHGSTDPKDDQVTRHAYRDGDLRVGTVLPRGNRLCFDYNRRRLATRVARGQGTAEQSQWNLEYDGDGLLIRRVDGRGLATTFEYDGFGRVIATRNLDEGGNEIRFVRHDYDKSGNVVIERAFMPSVTHSYRLLMHVEFVYNALDWLIEVRERRFKEPIPYASDAIDLGQSGVAPYDHVPLQDAVRTLYFHDQGGRLIRKETKGRRIEPDGQGGATSTPASLEERYSYDALGWLIEQEDPAGNRTKTHYDAHGIVTGIDVHEDVGNGEEVFSARFEVDSLDRVSATIDSLGNTERYWYDSRDNVVAQADPLGNIVRYDYDAWGRQTGERIEMTDSGLGGGALVPGSTIETRYEYDENDNLVRVVDADNMPIDRSFDSLDRVTAIRFPLGLVFRTHYDGNDNVVRERLGNGLIRETEYDALNNPTRVKIDDSQLSPGTAVGGATDERFSYDRLGRLVLASNVYADVALRTDSLGSVHEETVRYPGVARDFLIKRDVDDFGFLARLTYPDGRVLQYEPDSLNRIVRVSNQSNGVSFRGDASLPATRLLLQNDYRGLRLSSSVDGAGATTDYAHDGAGRVVDIRHRAPDGLDLLRIQYLHDAAGNIRLANEYTPGQQPTRRGERYWYDSRSQLTRYDVVDPPAQPFAVLGLGPATAPAPPGVQPAGQADLDQLIDGALGSMADDPQQATWKYDKSGSRTEQKISPIAQGIPYTSNPLHQYLARGATQFQHDANGNRMRRTEPAQPPRTYVHNHRDQLVETSINLDMTRSAHDALGRRVWLEENGDRLYFLNDGENLIEGRRTIGGELAVEFQYVSEDSIDSHVHVARGGEELWFKKDLVNSTRVLVGEPAAGPQLFRYDPFGNLEHGASNGPIRSLFAGRYLDPSTDLYDFRMRTYDPTTGSFLERDPEGDDRGASPYVYAANSPKGNVDPQGLSPRIASIPPSQQKPFLAYLKSKLKEFDQQTRRLSTWRRIIGYIPRDQARRVLASNIRAYEKTLGSVKHGEHIVPIPTGLGSLAPAMPVEIMPGLKLSFNSYVTADTAKLGLMNRFAIYQAKVGLMNSTIAIFAGFAGVAARVRNVSQLRNAKSTGLPVFRDARVVDRPAAVEVAPVTRHTGAANQTAGRHRNNVDMGRRYDTFEDAFRAKTRTSSHILEVIVRASPGGKTVDSWWEVSGSGGGGVCTEIKALSRINLRSGMEIEMRGGWNPCTLPSRHSCGCHYMLDNTAYQADVDIMYRSPRGNVFYGGGIGHVSGIMPSNSSKKAK